MSNQNHMFSQYLRRNHFYRVAGVYIGRKVTFGLLVVIKLDQSNLFFGENMLSSKTNRSIDYENIGSLEGVSLHDFDKVLFFTGARQETS